MVCLGLTSKAGQKIWADCLFTHIYIVYVYNKRSTLVDIMVPRFPYHRTDLFYMFASINSIMSDQNVRMSDQPAHFADIN